MNDDRNITRLLAENTRLKAQVDRQAETINRLNRRNGLLQRRNEALGALVPQEVITAAQRAR